MAYGQNAYSSHPLTSILAELCSNHHCDVLCLQETHRRKRQQSPIHKRYIARHRDSIVSTEVLSVPSSVIEDKSVSEDDIIEALSFFSVELSSVVVKYVYKPPSGDFNSHNTQWDTKKLTKMKSQ